MHEGINEPWRCASLVSSGDDILLSSPSLGASSKFICSRSHHCVWSDPVQPQPSWCGGIDRNFIFRLEIRLKRLGLTMLKVTRLSSISLQFVVVSEMPVMLCSLWLVREWNSFPISSGLISAFTENPARLFTFLCCHFSLIIYQRLFKATRAISSSWDAGGVKTLRSPTGIMEYGSAGVSCIEETRKFQIELIWRSSRRTRRERWPRSSCQDGRVGR